MEQKRIVVPTTNANSWKCLLADPEKHWREGFSAKLAAESWETANGIPEEIVLGLNADDRLRDSELLVAIPEFKVALPGGSRPSQNDVLAIVSNAGGLSVLTIEAKAREDFGPRIGQWLDAASAGKRERLQYILNCIEFKADEYAEMRYQLFHRMASAVIMARKFHARNAVMVVQSFVESDTENHYGDFQTFLSGFGCSAEKGKPVMVGEPGGVNLLAMWVSSAS